MVMLLNLWKTDVIPNARALLLIGVFGEILISCGSTSKLSDDKDKRQYLDELVSQRHFEIQSDRAMPMATASLNSIINVNGSQRFPIRYSGSVKAMPKEK